MCVCEIFSLVFCSIYFLQISVQHPISWCHLSPWQFTLLRLSPPGSRQCSSRGSTICYARSHLPPLHVLFLLSRRTFHLSQPEKHSLILYDLGLVVSCEYIFLATPILFGQSKTTYGLELNCVHGCWRLSPFIVSVCLLPALVRELLGMAQCF